MQEDSKIHGLKTRKSINEDFIVISKAVDQFIAQGKVGLRQSLRQPLR
jgi:hypothetical protein